MGGAFSSPRRPVPPRRRHRRCAREAPDEKPHVPDENVPAQRTPVSVSRGGYYPAEHERADHDVRTAPDAKDRASQAVPQEAERSAAPTGGQTPQRKRQQAGDDLRGTVVAPRVTTPSASARGPGSRSRRPRCRAAACHPSSSRRSHRRRRRQGRPRPTPASERCASHARRQRYRGSELIGRLSVGRRLPQRGDPPGDAWPR